MATETARKRGRPKKTDGEAVETVSTTTKKAKKEDVKTPEKRVRKKKIVAEVEIQQSPQDPLLVDSDVSNKTPAEAPVPGPMTAKILEQITLAKEEAGDHRSAGIEQEQRQAKNPAPPSSAPQKSFASSTMSAFSHSTPQHQLAAMSTKAKPPSATPKSSPKPPAAPKPPSKSSKAASTPKTAAAPSVPKSTPSQTKPKAPSTPKPTSSPKPLPSSSVLPDPPVPETIQPRATPQRLNKMAVDSLTHPVVTGSGEGQQATLGKPPARYKPVARRLTVVIVSLPIFLVTSWVLYERLVLNKERKQLPPIPKDLANLKLPKWLVGGNVGSDHQADNTLAAEQYEQKVQEPERAVLEPAKKAFEPGTERKWSGSEG